MSNRFPFHLQLLRRRSYCRNSLPLSVVMLLNFCRKFGVFRSSRSMAFRMVPAFRLGSFRMISSRLSRSVRVSSTLRPPLALTMRSISQCPYSSRLLIHSGLISMLGSAGCVILRSGCFDLGRFFHLSQR